MKAATARRVWSLPQVGLRGIVAGFVLALLLFPYWTVDDAFISLRYAQNLVEHGQLTWNVGDPVEGYTGILWIWLAAGAMELGLPALQLLKLIGLACTVGMLILSDRILDQMGATDRQRRIAVGILAVGPWWLMHAQSGLETALFVVLVLVAWLLYLRSSPWLPLACLTAALTRPDGVVLGAIMLAATMPRWDRTWLIAWIGLFITPAALYMSWRIGYYGDLLPNTYYAKSGGGGWSHVGMFAAQCLLPALAWAASGPDLRKLRSGDYVPLGVFALVVIVVYGRSEPLMNYAHRFFMPILPLIVIGMVASWGARNGRLAWVGYGAACVLALFHYSGYAYHYNLMDTQEHQPAAAWISANVPDDSTLLVMVDAGRVPYETKLRTIDGGALNDRYLARQREPADQLEYIFSQKPDVVLLATGKLGIVAAEATRAAMLVDPRWIEHYELAATFAGGQRFEYHQQVYLRR